MIKLIELLSHLSNFLFNGYSHNKLYFFFPLSVFFKFNLNKDEQEILRANEIDEQKNVIYGYHNFFFLLNKIYKKISQFNFEHKPDFEINLKQKPDLQYPLNEFEKLYNRYNGLELFEYIIHGSYADNTATEFSDIDDVVFIKEEVYKDYTKFKTALNLLSKLNLKYQQIDFTQHHGHHIFTCFDKYYYNTFIMPVVIYSDAIAIGQNLKIRLQMDNLKEKNYKQIFNHQLELLEKNVDQIKINSMNLFDLNEFIARIVFIIPLCFQVQEIMLSKREAFVRASEIFSPKALTAIEWATKIRSNWKDIKYYKLSKMKIKAASIIFHNRRMLQQISHKLPIKIRRKDILYLDSEVIAGIESLMEEAKRYV